jgi:DNA topoisomerase-1
MRFNSIASSELQQAWLHLESSLKEGWVNKAQFRQTFDLLTGAAFTRLLTLGIQAKGVRNLLISWGSVQTPTLYFVVQREKEIINFVAEKYWILKALLETDEKEKFEAHTEHVKTAVVAKQIYDKVKNAKYGTVADYSESVRVLPRPYPLRTDDALRDLSKITSLSAAQSLTILERLYSSGYCMPPDTLIPLKNGEIKEIQSLEAESEPLGYYDNFAFTKVNAILTRHAPKIMYRIETSTNREISLTPEHPILVVSPGGEFEWKQVADVNCQDVVVTPRKIPVHRQTTPSSLIDLINETVPETDCWNVRFHLKTNTVERMRKALRFRARIKKRQRHGRYGRVHICRRRGVSLLSEDMGIKDVTMYRWFRTAKIPFPVMMRLLAEHLISLKRIQRAYIGIAVRSGHSGSHGSIPIPFFMTTAFAHFLGLNIADGHNDRSHMSFALKLPRHLESESVINTYASCFALHLMKTRRGFTYTNAYPLTFLFQHLGSPGGKKSYKVFIHPFMLKQPDNIVQALLAGLWDGDGNFHSRTFPQASLSTRSEKLQKIVEMVLRQFGIRAYFYKSNRNGRPLGIKVYSNDLLKLDKLLKTHLRIRGHQLSDMRNKLKNMRRTRTMVMDARSLDLPNAMAKRFLSTVSIRKLERSTHATFQNIKYGGANMPDEKFMLLSKNLDTLLPVDCIFEQVKKIAPIKAPCRTVYDLTTSCASFVANGILVHNCSYPRTDTNKYQANFDFGKSRKAVDASQILANISVPITVNPRNGQLDDGAHPPIYPIKPYLGSDRMEKSVWEYVARRFIANAYMDDAQRTDQGMAVSIEDVPFASAGGYLAREGFFQAYSYFQPSDKRLPKLSEGDRVKVVRLDLADEETKPPSRLTEAELLRLLEKNGLGTAATRASFPSLIIKRGYAIKVDRRFKPTSLGMALIDALTDTDSKLPTPDTRRLVEERMRAIEAGTVKFDDALNEMTDTYALLLSFCRDRLDAISAQLAHTVSPQSGYSAYRTSKPNKHAAAQPIKQP